MFIPVVQVGEKTLRIDLDASSGIGKFCHEAPPVVFRALSG
jgi:hypothetical protein